MSQEARRVKATLFLVLATAFWSVSFPVMKALGLAQQTLLPEASTWFVSSVSTGYRFGLASAVMLLVCLATLRRFTRLEVWEGLGLGFFSGGGLVFQMDGLAYTDASISAFLTQCYVLFIPLWVALAERRWPSRMVVVSCALVAAGVAVLSKADWRNFHLGRGELETLIASVFFTGHILWLQRPKFARNNVNHFTLVMFAVIALCGWLLAGLAAGPSAAWVRSFNTWPTLLFLGILAGFCTLGGYLLMNYWQPCVTATQAGLIYSVEPVFASLSALFLPGWFAQLARIDYANERVTSHLLLGGGLITLANVLFAAQSRKEVN